MSIIEAQKSQRLLVYVSLEEILLSVIKIFLLGREASLQIATLWLIFPFLVKMTLRGDSIQIDEFLGEGDG